MMMDEHVVEYVSGLPAVKSVTNDRIRYTDEFKRRVAEGYRRGESPVAMFRKAGLGSEVIGVFCQIEVVQNGVSIQSEKAAGFSPVERKDPPPLLFGFYPIRAWVRLYDSPSNLIILP